MQHTLSPLWWWTRKLLAPGTSKSTAAPPLVTTLTIFFYSFTATFVGPGSAAAFTALRLVGAGDLAGVAALDLAGVLAGGDELEDTSLAGCLGVDIDFGPVLALGTDLGLGAGLTALGAGLAAFGADFGLDTDGLG